MLCAIRMGGAKKKTKKKNCSGCKGYHRSPWGQYLKKESEPPVSPFSWHHSSLVGSELDLSVIEPVDKSAYVALLEERIAKVEEYHKRQYEGHNRVYRGRSTASEALLIFTTQLHSFQCNHNAVVFIY